MKTYIEKYISTRKFCLCSLFQLFLKSSMHLLGLLHYKKMQIHDRKVSMQIFKWPVYIYIYNRWTANSLTLLLWTKLWQWGTPQAWIKHTIMYSHYACVHWQVQRVFETPSPDNWHTWLHYDHNGVYPLLHKIWVK